MCCLGFVAGHSHQQPRVLQAVASKLICGLRVGARGLEPPQGAPGKMGPLGASEQPTLFSHSFADGHTSPRPLKSLSRGPESLSGALRGLWEGVSETPNY